MDTKMKTGRPRDGATKETVSTIHVALDEATAAALKRLELALYPGLSMRRGRTSATVRRAIHVAVEWLKKP